MAYRTVLIEENKMMMERLTSVVRNLAGFEVSARYATAGDALGQMQAFNPDLILVDVDNEHNALLIPDLKEIFQVQSLSVWLAAGIQKRRQNCFIWALKVTW